MAIMAEVRLCRRPRDGLTGRVHMRGQPHQGSHAARVTMSVHDDGCSGDSVTVTVFSRSPIRPSGNLKRVLSADRGTRFLWGPFLGPQIGRWLGTHSTPGTIVRQTPKRRREYDFAYI
jgi:hypothetical protein